MYVMAHPLYFERSEFVKQTGVIKFLEELLSIMYINSLFKIYLYGPLYSQIQISQILICYESHVLRPKFETAVKTNCFLNKSTPSNGILFCIFYDPSEISILPLTILLILGALLTYLQPFLSLL